jgi:hypothetical protein
MSDVELIISTFFLFKLLLITEYMLKEREPGQALIAVGARH